MRTEVDPVFPQRHFSFSTNVRWSVFSRQEAALAENA